MQNYIVNNLGQFMLFLMLIIAWSGIWKALALWKASRLGSKAWFVTLFILNTAGVLEILYIFVFSKMTKKTKQL